jgi:hypothetical protein
MSKAPARRNAPTQPADDPQLEFLHYQHSVSRFHTPALRAFLLCAEQKLPVPNWLMEFMASGLRRHLDAHVSLDSSIGVVRPGQGSRSTDDTKFAQWEMDWHRAQGVENAKNQKKITLEQACRELARPHDKGGLFAGMTARSLRDLYKKKRAEFRAAPQWVRLTQPKRADAVVKRTSKVSVALRAWR